MRNPDSLRSTVRDNLQNVVVKMNNALRGHGLSKLRPVLTRLGRGGMLPHWYQQLKSDGTLPNLDGKTIGSIVEMLFVAIIETTVLRDAAIELRINPARGVDIPDLDLGVKSPSKNYCTSEPFLSAYDRMLGSAYDVLVLLTDYQDRKKTPPLRLKIIDSRYLLKTQVADKNLCRIAKSHRDWLIEDNPATAQKFFKFLAYINQSDWRAKWILQLVEALQDERQVSELIDKCNKDFAKKNKTAMKKDKVPIPETELDAINRIRTVSPTHVAVIEAADNWVLEVLKEAARPPNENEWQRFKDGALDGRIGMSFALQWRYNFGTLFGKKGFDDKPVEIKL